MKLLQQASAERAQVPATTQDFVGNYFAISYPSGWDVDTNELPKGSYLDTTIRSPSDPNKMLRVDIQTQAASADPGTNADQLEAALSSQPGYRELGFNPTTFNSYKAVRWEFLVSERGILLHKVDVIFVDDAGDDVAVLTQTPAASYPYWQRLFSEVRSSFIANDTAPTTASSGDFCSTHACIANFNNGTGYIVQCADGMWSHSGGRPGACSYHDGETSNVYTGPDTSSNSGTQGTDLGPGNGYAVTCADGSISHSGGIQGACSHHGGVAP